MTGSETFAFVVVDAGGNELARSPVRTNGAKIENADDLGFEVPEGGARMRLVAVPSGDVLSDVPLAVTT